MASTERPSVRRIRIVLLVFFMSAASGLAGWWAGVLGWGLESYGECNVRVVNATGVVVRDVTIALGRFEVSIRELEHASEAFVRLPVLNEGELSVAATIASGNPVRGAGGYLVRGVSFEYLVTLETEGAQIALERLRDLSQP